MEIRKLEWDSEFFGLQIGRVDLQTLDDAVDLALMHYDLKFQYDLLYVFSKEGLSFDAIGAELIDEKVLYGKPCEPRERYNDISFYKQDVPSEDLYRLALVSGGYSRFKLDGRLPQGCYERLYTRWIENACPKDGTNKQILTYLDAQNVAKGMITIDHQGELGHIGLVAVDADCQHQGIGGKIMSSLDGYLYGLGVKTLEVPTQKVNKDACRWYEKNGFKVKSVTPIYHWWL